MLDALPRAQSNGQKAQEDAARGQASIFDMGGDEPDQGAQNGLARQHPSLIGEEFEPRELLSLERETLGTFLSEHPLTEVRDALMARVDRPLAELARAPDGAWVRAGGLITESKRIRTKRGHDMMFATLDDLEGQVELIIFNSALEKSQKAIEPDSVVIVKGRVDHKEPGETKLVVAEAEVFEPGTDELEAARRRKGAVEHPEQIVLRVDARDLAPTLIEQLKAVFANFPGESEVVLEMRTREGTRRLRFGRDYRITPSQGLRSEIDELLGSQAIAA
jgi:DNA polymerase-3 subunit alpha